MDQHNCFLFVVSKIGSRRKINFLSLQNVILQATSISYLIFSGQLFRSSMFSPIIQFPFGIKLFQSTTSESSFIRTKLNSPHFFFLYHYLKEARRIWLLIKAYEHDQTPHSPPTLSLIGQTRVDTNFQFPTDHGGTLPAD